jgi:hypothetical protein
VCSEVVRRALLCASNDNLIGIEVIFDAINEPNQRVITLNSCLHIEPQDINYNSARAITKSNFIPVNSLIQYSKPPSTY